MIRIMSRYGERWNHNVHYDSKILRPVPPQARRALDVGCGEGMLTCELANQVPIVVGIDADEVSINQARNQAGEHCITYLLGDFLKYPVENESFDFIASVATLHHVDAATALTRMRGLLRPGGVLAVVGLARFSSLRDVPFEVAGAIAHRAYSLLVQAAEECGGQLNGHATPQGVEQVEQGEQVGVANAERAAQHT